MIGLYQPGTSVIHRMSAGLKLLLLATGIFAVIWLDRPWQVGAALLVVGAMYGVAGIGWRTALAQLRPLLWVVLALLAFQLILATWHTAVMTTGSLVINVALAALVTVTTKVTAILDVVQRVLRPLRRFGLDPDRVGLMLALTIRCIPLVAGIVHDVSQARKARGITGIRGTMVALAAPAVVRALRTADSLGEALTARGVDD
ncbi:energy-coupling factor transporter transmembrane protein EcfT [Nakamurella antarctica]|uniref:Energy-coupling factor transporter transmembrane protein EcfT n=1 Tax=Nakamurella antarctica TaxID=1902245 RepID=A0A3G8ZJC4_9ACTN|nr:energy-coupling factor transporter transmembrane protein EcfT [Nakamurella antarctica]AZI57298.1 energy-coupling factor transporter transmembrane protein EcfT [Nakamurella antarctica]